MTVLKDFSGRSWGLDIVTDVYIETGCGNGDSLEGAAYCFQECHGIDVNQEAINRCYKRIPHSHVVFHKGSSVQILPAIINRNWQTTFYLDAHYEGPEYWDPKTQCPLLDELRIICSVPWKHKPVILIDDYSAFMSKDEWWKRFAGPQLDRSQWPTFGEIFDVMNGCDYRFNFLACTDGILYCW